MTKILECNCGKKVKVNKYVCDHEYICHSCRNAKKEQVNVDSK